MMLNATVNLDKKVQGYVNRYSYSILVRIIIILSKHIRYLSSFLGRHECNACILIIPTHFYQLLTPHICKCKCDFLS